MPLRTAEQFDAWFVASRGDPWDSGSPFVRDRLTASLSFICRRVAADFRGTFLELGAFNGQFTELLAQSFPKAIVAASDISQVALNISLSRVGKLTNVFLHQADMADYELPPSAQPPFVVLLLECIYYLPPEEHVSALTRLISLTDGADVYLSTPITGEPYPSEEELMRKMSRVGYACRDALVLNNRHFAARLLPRTAINLCRSRLARQVIYRFSKAS
jgi:SAM-dependent methyltransferase